MGLFGFFKKEPKPIYLQVHEAYEDEEEDENPLVRINQKVMDLIDNEVNYVLTTEPDGYFVEIRNRNPIVKDPKFGRYQSIRTVAKCIPLRSSDKDNDKKISFKQLGECEEIKDNKSTIQFFNLKAGYGGVGIIRINRIGRLSGRIALNSTVEVNNVRAAYAEIILVKILNNKHNALREEFIRSELFGHVVFKDQLTRIFFGDEIIPLKIMGASNSKRIDSALIVNEFTRVSVTINV